MTPHLNDTVLHDLSHLLGEKMGIHFPRERWKDMERGINAAARELGYKEIQSFINGLLASELSRTQFEFLASHLTVGETYFFREPKSFDAIGQQVISQLINKRSGKDQHLRIWSAGCATGEEPYSLAILLYQLIPDLTDWNISILATDINPRFLQKAEQGVYSKWSFRGVPDRIVNKYFTVNADGKFRIHPQIKRLVTFNYLNLAEDVYPSLTNSTNGMDLILCRNVLMYFGMPRVKQVVDNLRRCLIDGGYLAVSSVEMSHVLFSAFEPVTYHDVTLYRKTDSCIEKHDYVMDCSFLPLTEERHTVNADPADILMELLSTPDKDAPLPAQDTPQTETEKTESGRDDITGLYRQGHYAEVISILTVRLAESPQDAISMALMARALANQGQLAEARQWCEKAISHNKLDAACYYLLATIQQECDQTNDAVTTLKRVLYLDPEMVLAHFALGNIARSQGRTLEAVRHFTNTLGLLKQYQPGDVLPESEGMTAQRLREIIEAVNYGQQAA
jgi:chemotaxis protein methyltransferase CheR